MTRPFEPDGGLGAASLLRHDDSSMVESLRRAAKELDRLALHAGGADAYRFGSAARAVHLALVQLESSSN